ncbi:MAG: PDR/VanB family oxidoreductase, partial [Clostridia bacterium]
MKSKINVIVKQIIHETPAVKRFRLVTTSGAQLPPFSAGSHITTYLETETGTIERHYSLVNSPDDFEHYEICIHLNPESRGGSSFWHHSISEGHELSISYPKNHFPLSFRARHHIFFAAGIGITPFLTMMDELAREGKSFELHYAAKSNEHCAFYIYLQEHYPHACQFYFSTDSVPRRMKPDIMRNQRIGTHVYFCGPEPMVRQFQEAAIEYGYPEASIHFELFTPPVPKTRNPFSVELSLSQQTITVGEDESLLDALLSAGIPAHYSCRVGGCGTCAVEVASGEIAHYDSVLSEKERAAHNQMMTCVSRAA